MITEALIIGFSILAAGYLLRRKPLSRRDWTPTSIEMSMAQIAKSLVLLVDLIDRELPPGYRHKGKMRERHGPK